MNWFNSAISLYSWIVAAAIVFFLYHIARFFEEKAGQRSYYQVFLIPMIAFVLGALQYMWRSDDFVGDILGDALFFGGGLALVLASGYLLHLMVGRRK